MAMFFFFSSRRRHTRCYRDWSSDVCSSDLPDRQPHLLRLCPALSRRPLARWLGAQGPLLAPCGVVAAPLRTYDFDMAERSDVDAGLQLAARLSPRERQVIELAASGLTNQQIALRLQIS